MNFNLTPNNFDNLIGERFFAEVANFLAEIPVEVFVPSAGNMLLPANFNCLKLRLTDANSDTDVGFTVDDVSQLIDHMVSIGAALAFDRFHIIIIQELYEMSRSFLLFLCNVVFMQRLDVFSCDSCHNPPVIPCIGVF